MAQFGPDAHGIDGALCAAIDAPLVGAEIADAFGISHGLSIAEAELAQDKFLQKKRLHALGISVPAFLQAFNGRAITEAQRLWRDTVVVKPADSRGGRGVIRCTEAVDPDFAYQIAHDNSPTGRVLVERWLDGPQLSTESIVQNGEVLFTAVGLRNYARLEEFAPFVIEDGFDEPFADTMLQPEIDNLIEAACRALGWYQLGAGTVKGDLVIHDGVVHIIELAARLSGGFFATHGHPLAYGVDFVGQAVKAALCYIL